MSGGSEHATLTISALKRDLAAARRMRLGMTGDRLRTMAEHVNIDVLRKIDEPEEILRRFSELRGHLLAWADVVDPPAAKEGKMSGWQELVGKKSKNERPFERELTIDLYDNKTKQHLQITLKRAPLDIEGNHEEIRKELHANLDKLIDKITL